MSFIFGSKREGVAGARRRLYKGEVYGLYASPNDIGAVKSRMS
jgi:hypothetical protein